MAEESEDLSIVHLQVDAIDCLEAVWIHLEKTFHSEILVFKLKSGDFRRNRLMVFFFKILGLKRIRDSVLS